MAIHILNCVSMSPWWPRWHMGGTVLLVETDEGPVLVDTGLGLRSYSHPSHMVRFFMADFGIHRDSDRAAVRQVVNYGWQPDKVRHIVMTHLHFDHSGGLPDFPHAWVHIYQAEYAALRKPRGLTERVAYNQLDFAHGPKWVFHEQQDARWFGFDAIRLDFKPEMYLVPLTGHTRGHCGVVIRDGNGWLFNAADALPTNAEFDLTPGWLSRLVIGPHVPRLKAFAAEHPEVRILAGHMWLDWFGREGSK